MKRIFFIFLIPFCFFHAAVHAQASPRVDSVALYILDRTAATIQSQSSCSFVTTTSYDVWQEGIGYVKNTTEDRVWMKFPDKMKVNLWGDKGHRTLYYNGNYFSYYSYGNNHYSWIPAKGTIVQAVDTINKTYGVEFPAADFFYPDFVNDLLNTGGNLIYLGISQVQGKPCYHIAGNDVDGTVFQFWLSQDEFFLPVKMVLTYKETTGQPQYEAIYSDWEINPVLSDAMFEFVPPPGSQLIKMAPVK